MPVTTTREPPGTSGPTKLTIPLEQNETRVVTLVFWTWTEANGWNRLSLTGKTIRLRAIIDGTVFRWDNGANAGLVLAADQTANKGECDVTLTSAKGTQKAGEWFFEAWDATTGTEHKHGEGYISVTASGGPT